MRRLVSALPAVLAVALVSAAAAAADNGLSPVQPVSPNAHAIRTTYWVILIITAVIFLLVETALLVFIVRFRSRRRGRDQEAPQIHGATKLETSFTIVPVLILFGIMAFVFVKLPTIKDVPSARAAGELKIRVVAHQFYWEFQYPSGRVAMEHMVVPIDRVVTLGQTQSQAVFEIMGRKGELTPVQIELRDRFSEGLAAYRAQRWDDARRKFEAALLAVPNDGPSMTFIQRLDGLAAAPPDDGWDGAWHFDKK